MKTDENLRDAQRMCMTHHYLSLEEDTAASFLA